MSDWTEGAPPELSNEDNALIVVELPSLFYGVKVVNYKCARWMGENWSEKEVYRANRWMAIPLPVKE